MNVLYQLLTLINRLFYETLNNNKPMGESYIVVMLTQQSKNLQFTTTTAFSLKKFSNWIHLRRIGQSNIMQLFSID